MKLIRGTAGFLVLALVIVATAGTPIPNDIQATSHVSPVAPTITSPLRDENAITTVGETVPTPNENSPNTPSMNNPADKVPEEPNSKLISKAPVINPVASNNNPDNGEPPIKPDSNGNALKSDLQLTTSSLEKNPHDPTQVMHNGISIDPYYQGNVQLEKDFINHANNDLNKVVMATLEMDLENIKVDNLDGKHLGRLIDLLEEIKKRIDLFKRDISDILEPLQNGHKHHWHHLNSETSKPEEEKPKPASAKPETPTKTDTPPKTDKPAKEPAKTETPAKLEPAKTDPNENMSTLRRVKRNPFFGLGIGGSIGLGIGGGLYGNYGGYGLGYGNNYGGLYGGGYPYGGGYNSFGSGYSNFGYNNYGGYDGFFG